MSIKIKRLTPELLGDYLDFFDNKAFIDNKKWSQCYCMFFHYDDRLKKIEKDAGKPMSREFAIEYINSGKLQGYLAYKEDEVVGWCNANDKSAYYAYRKENAPSLWDDSDINAKTKAITCFLIAPNMRGKKIATKLLEHIIIDAKAHGFNRVEAYPLKGEHDCYMHYHGPLGLYEKSGFIVYKENDDIYTVRKDL